MSRSALATMIQGLTLQMEQDIAAGTIDLSLVHEHRAMICIGARIRCTTSCETSRAPGMKSAIGMLPTCGPTRMNDYKTMGWPMEGQSATCRRVHM